MYWERTIWEVTGFGNRQSCGFEPRLPDQLIKMRYKKIRLDKDNTIDEHRLVMENYLGRKLTPEEVVHHKDGDGFN